MGVFTRFLQVNLIANGYSQTEKEWKAFFNTYLVQQALMLETTNLELLEIESQEEKGVLGVVTAPSIPTRALLKIILHDSFNRLNVLSTSDEISNKVITYIYPETSVSTLFYRVDINKLDTLPLTFGSDITKKPDFSYNFLYAEELYFVLLVRGSDNRTEERFYLYNLDGILAQYLTDSFNNRVVYVGRESRLGSVLLKDQFSYDIHMAKLEFDWTGFGLLARYNVRIPASWHHLDLVKIAWQRTLINLFFYFQPIRNTG